jgi:hypothetical protein
MGLPSKADIAELRAKAIAIGIDFDGLPPLLRMFAIVRPRAGSDRQPGLLPVCERTVWNWVREGLLEPPTKFADGISAWPKVAIIRIAVYGLLREPGHGRKLTGPAPTSSARPTCGRGRPRKLSREAKP